MIDRMDRIGKSIQKEVSSILSTEIEDKRVQGVSITYVEVTRDLGLAKIYFNVDGDQSVKDQVEELLEKYAKFIRGEISRRIALKFMPRLSFRQDKHEEYVNRIDALIEKISKERKENSSGEEAEAEGQNENE